MQKQRYHSDGSCQGRFANPRVAVQEHRGAHAAELLAYGSSSSGSRAGDQRRTARAAAPQAEMPRSHPPLRAR